MEDKAFQSFVSDPVAFLKGKTLGIQTMAGEDGILKKETLTVEGVDVEIKAFDPLRRCKTMYLIDRVRGNTAEVYVSKDPESGSRKLLGFYLPWATNEVHAVKLSEIEGVDFFVTAQLNGCCVFVNGDAKSPVVMHANVQNDELALNQEKDESYEDFSLRVWKRKMQVWNKLYYSLGTRLIDSFWLDGKATTSAFEPMVYQSKMAETARVFGVKRDGAWSFYYVMDTLTKTMKGYAKGAQAGRLWPTMDKP